MEGIVWGWTVTTAKTYMIHYSFLPSLPPLTLSYNKQVLAAFPYPLTCTCLQVCGGKGGDV